MAIPLMEEDVEVISKLGDTPGSDDGLATSQLKARFDLAAIRIKKYINETLIPNMNMLVDVQALLGGILDATLSAADKAAPAKTVGERIAEVLKIAQAALPVSGGAMSGGINMNNQQLTGIPTPVTAANAVNKAYVDTATVRILLQANAWEGETAPYFQTVEVNGLTNEKTADGYPVYPGIYEADLAMQEACSCVSYAMRDGTDVTFYCLSYKPETDITIDVEVGV